jgi:hypothetical protein
MKFYRISIMYLIVCYSPLVIQASEFSACGNNEKATQLSQLIINDPEQQRENIRCNKLLTRVAESKAKKMAEYGIVAHNLGGSPNDNLESAGYKLPKHYGREINSNQVEALAGGYSDEIAVWQAFKDSTVHRTHLLGEHEFYIEQDEIGVAFISEWSSPHVEYWVIYLAEGLKDNQKYINDIENVPNKSLFILQKNN